MLKINLFKLKYNISDELIWAKKLAMCPSIAMIPLAAVGSQSEITFLRLAFVRDFGAQNCQPSTKAQLEN